MGYGINGFKCEDCRAEWNLSWSTVTMQFPVAVCPNCVSENIKRLDQTVPFRLHDGVPPDHVYHCVCGKIFQKHPSPDFDPFTEDKEKVIEQLKVKCPFCKRTNNHSIGWYIPN